MPAYASIEDRAPDALGYYQRERTCSFMTQRVLLGITAVLFVLLGISVIIVAVVLDLFLLSLWFRMFVAVFAFGLGLIVAGTTGSLAVHTRNTFALVLFAFFALFLVAASLTMIIFSFEESTKADLPGIRDNWENSLNDDDKTEKLCRLQREIDCLGWYPGCPTDSSVWSDNNSPTEPNMLQRGQRNVGAPTTTQSASSQGGGEFSDSSADGGYPWTPSKRRELLCPVCKTNPNTNTTCLSAVRDRVDEFAPIVTGGSFGMLILLATMLAWSYKIRRKARRPDPLQAEADAALADGSHPYKYL